MKQILTCLFLLAATVGRGQTAAVAAGPAVSVEVSCVYCLVRFVQTVASD